MDFELKNLYSRDKQPKNMKHPIKKACARLLVGIHDKTSSNKVEAKKYKESAFVHRLRQVAFSIIILSVLVNREFSLLTLSYIPLFFYLGYSIDGKLTPWVTWLSAIISSLISILLIIVSAFTLFTGTYTVAPWIFMTFAQMAITTTLAWRDIFKYIRKGVLQI